MKFTLKNFSNTLCLCNCVCVLEACSPSIQEDNNNKIIILHTNKLLKKSELRNHLHNYHLIQLSLDTWSNNLTSQYKSITVKITTIIIITLINTITISLVLYKIPLKNNTTHVCKSFAQKWPALSHQNSIKIYSFKYYLQLLHTMSCKKR